MKTLAILLCLLIVVVPAGAQQIAERPAPNFYVPYAVGLSRPAAESSSDDARLTEPAALPSAEPAQRFPIRRGYPRFARPFMGYPPMPAPPVSIRAGLIIAGAVAGFVILGAVKGRQ